MKVAPPPRPRTKFTRNEYEICYAVTLSSLVLCVESYAVSLWHRTSHTLTLSSRWTSGKGFTQWKEATIFYSWARGKGSFFGGASCAYSHGNYGQLDDIGTRVTLTANRAWPTSKTAGFHAFCAVGGSVQLLLRFRLLFLFCFFMPKGKDSWAWPPPSLQHCFLFAWGIWCWSCWTRLLSTPEEYFLWQRLENLHLVIHVWADLFRLLLAQFSSVPRYHHVALLHMTACWDISCFFCKTKKKVCGLHCCILQLSFFLCFVLLMLVFFFETVDNNRK